MKSTNEQAKIQWRSPHHHYRPLEICNPAVADLPSPPYRADRWGMHHVRVKILGYFLQKWISKTGYFQEYRFFLAWAEQFFDADAEAIKESIIRVGLWWSGEPGRPGGPELIQMQAELVAYAIREGGELW